MILIFIIYLKMYILTTDSKRVGKKSIIDQLITETQMASLVTKHHNLHLKIFIEV